MAPVSSARPRRTPTTIETVAVGDGPSIKKNNSVIKIYQKIYGQYYFLSDEINSKRNNVQVANFILGKFCTTVRRIILPAYCDWRLDLAVLETKLYPSLEYLVRKHHLHFYNRL